MKPVALGGFALRLSGAAFVRLTGKSAHDCANTCGNLAGFVLHCAWRLPTLQERVKMLLRFIAISLAHVAGACILLPVRGNHATAKRGASAKINGAKGNMSKIENMAALLNALGQMGFSYSEAKSLRRIEMTLHRWGEQECGDSNDHCSWSIERDETTGKPFMCVYPHTDIKPRRNAIADREAGALRRLARLMENHPRLVAYHQTDPRGCSLYIVRKSDAGENIQSTYTRGVAVAA